MTCAAVTQRLRNTAGRLPRRADRTPGVVLAYQVGKRLAPFAERAGVDLTGTPPQAIDAMLFQVVGNAQMDQPQVDPHVVEARVLSEMAKGCAKALDGWKAPPVTELPPDVAALGYADHLVGGKTVREVFPDGKVAALTRAACEGDLAGVSQAMHAGAQPNARGFEGTTPLIWVLTCENLPGLEALLAAGADANQDFGEGRTAVLIAAGYRDTSILKLLLRYKGDPNARDKRNTALMTAYDMGRHGAGWGAWDVLLAAGADINQVVGEDPENFPRTVALYAAERNDFVKVLELLDRGYSQELAELGRQVEISGKLSIFPEAEAARKKVQSVLVARGVTFPVPRRTIWFRYKALDGAERKAIAGEPSVNLGVRYFDDGREDLWYLGDVGVFVESIEDEQSPRNGMIEVDQARLKSRWRLSDEQIAAIRQSPQSWERKLDER